MSVGATGCNAGITETVVAYVPPREGRCSLETMFMESVNQAEWDVVGWITIDDPEGQYPLSPRYRKIVQPRACRMGGDAVAVIAGGERGTGVLTRAVFRYAILKRKSFGAPPAWQQQQPNRRR